MGEFFSLVCALMWGCAVIFFRLAGLTVPPLALNLFRVTVSSLLFLITMAVALALSVGACAPHKRSSGPMPILACNAFSTRICFSVPLWDAHIKAISWSLN